MSFKRGAYKYKVFPEEITIENFKSIRSLTLKLKPGVNVLVGPNCAGKTNILEAIHFLTRALSRSELSKVPYAPHLPLYWGPEELFYERRVENPIGFEVLLRVTRRLDEEYAKHYVRFSVKFSIASDRSTVNPTYITIDWGTSKLEIGNGMVRVYVSSDYLGEYLEAMKAIEVGPERLTPREGRLLKSLLGRIEKLKESAGVSEGVRYLPLSARRRPLLPLLPAIEISSCYHKDELTELCVVDQFPPITSIPILLKWRPADRGEFKGWPQETPVLDLHTVTTWLEKGILLKHPDIGTISEPQPFTGGERLDVRARNIPLIIYKLFAERNVKLIKLVEESLRRVYTTGEISVEPRSSAGRVFLVIREREVELPPPNVADGLIKVLAIAVAVGLNPSILLIDEIENSLHARALEYVFDLLNSLEVPVVVATHSPIVVDLAGPERTVVVSRSPEHGTRVEYFEKTEELTGRLRELGVAFSDYVFYERTRQ